MAGETKSGLFALMLNLFYLMAKVDCSPRVCDEMVDNYIRGRGMRRDLDMEANRGRLRVRLDPSHILCVLFCPTAMDRCTSNGSRHVLRDLVVSPKAKRQRGPRQRGIIPSCMQPSRHAMCQIAVEMTRLPWKRRQSPSIKLARCADLPVVAACGCIQRPRP
jgi:hypothetical protein